MVDEGQPEAFRHHLGAFNPFVIRIMDGAFVVVAVHDVQHAAADALDDRRSHGLGEFFMGDWGGAVLQRLHAGPFGQLVDADGETAGTRAVFGGEVGGERVRVLVDQEGAVALAVGGDGAGLVAGHRHEAEHAEVVVQLLGLTGRSGEFNELETVDAHRVFEGDAGVFDLGVHAGSFTSFADALI